MSFYSKPTKQAILILTHIADWRNERFYTVRDVSMMTGVSDPTATKVLQMLAKDGLVESRKGPGGGFRLALPPEEVKIFRVVTAMEGGEPFSDCIGGLENCSEANPCPLHEDWKKVKKPLIRFLEETSLLDILSAARRMGRIGVS